MPETKPLSAKWRFAATALGLASLSACDLTAFCPADPVPVRGELGGLSDAVVVTPPGQEGEPRGFVVLANPEIEQLRIYDARDVSFLTAPNLYFPLSVVTGPATRQLAVPAQETSRLLALDSALGQLQLVRTVDEDAGPAWTTVGVVDTAPAPVDIAVIEDDDGLRAFVALPESSAVQVLAIDPATAAADEIALIELGEGSRPSAVAASPDGLTLVVADAALPSLALVDTSDLSVTRLPVGAPASDVVTGRVPLDDGLAPIALATLREGNAVAAVRLFRPTYREDRYALLGVAELPEVAAAAFIPDAAVGETPVPVCCASGENNEPPAAVVPTRAWAAVTTAVGRLVYVRLDGPIEVIDTNAAEPAPAVELDESGVFTAPSGGQNLRPALEITPTGDVGDPPRVPFFAEDLVYTLTYEGALPGLSDREADYDDGVVTVLGDGAATAEERSLEEGDLLVVDTSERGGTCPEEVEGRVQDLDGDTFVLVGVSALEEECLAQGGGFVFTAFASGDLVVESSEEGFLGRVFLPPPGEGNAVIDVPGLRFTLSSAGQGLPLPGSRFRIPIDQNLDPAGALLSSDQNVVIGELGFETRGRLPTAIAGGEVFVEDLVDDDNNSATEPVLTIVPVRRMWITTAAGALLELNQAEAMLGDVVERR